LGRPLPSIENQTMLGLGFQELKVNAQSTWSAWEAWWWKSLEGPDVSPSKEMGKPSDPGKGRQEPTSRETIQSSSVPLRIESRASVSNETPPAEGILSSIANYRTQPRPGDEQQYQYGLFSYLQRLFPEIDWHHPVGGIDASVGKNGTEVKMWPRNLKRTDFSDKSIVSWSTMKM